MHEALYYTQQNNDTVKCNLCPHNCTIKQGERGLCQARINLGGKLYAENYNKICSLALDPIEKKPLYHFYPGKTILTVGSLGCNLHCDFCQNWQISQTNADEYQDLTSISASEIINHAKLQTNNIGVAFSYNEPIVWFEFMYDIARESKNAGLKTAMISNGYINRDALIELLPVIDAFNIDLKAFSDDFYKTHTRAHLQPVLDNLKLIKEMGKHLEITNLVITGLNDNSEQFEQMLDWIVVNLGESTVLHISRYFPKYKSTQPATPVATLDKFYKMATKKLKYVYLGNVATNYQSDTFCPHCGATVICRQNYSTKTDGLTTEGRCAKCNFKILSHL